MADVFVYGTLKRGASAHHLIERHVRSWATGRVRGTLVSAGDYPAMIVSRDDACASFVHGEWLTVDDAALAAMDEWEGYWGPGDPRNEYERVIVVDADGRREGWAYVWNDARGCPVIPGGCWTEPAKGER